MDLTHIQEKFADHLLEFKLKQLSTLKEMFTSTHEDTNEETQECTHEETHEEDTQEDTHEETEEEKEENQEEMVTMNNMYSDEYQNQQRNYQNTINRINRNYNVYSGSELRRNNPDIAPFPFGER